VAKFPFTHSKLRNQPYFGKNLTDKCQISRSGVVQSRPATPITTPMKFPFIVVLSTSLVTNKFGNERSEHVTAEMIAKPWSHSSYVSE